MKPARILALLLALLMVLSVCACGGTTPDSKETDDSASSTEKTTDAGSQPVEITVTDMIGREVKVKPGSYRRVVCIGAGALRMYSYVADVGLLCGVEDIDNTSLTDRPKMFDAAARPYVMAYGDVFSKLPSCGVGGPNAQAAEAEKILSCNPDIVISEYEDADKENALQEQLGVPVITLRSTVNGVFSDEFKGSLRLLGKLFAADARAEELVTFIEAQTAALDAATANIPEEGKPSVYIAGLGNWGTTNHLMTIENYAVFKAAHIKNVVSGLGMKGIGAIEAEKFAALGADMDIMFLDAAAVKNIKPLYKEDPTMFDVCKAWQNGQVYLEMPYNAYYTNYEIALANAFFIASTVYPDAFPGLDMTAKLDEITTAFLGKALAQEIFAAPNSFGGYQKIDTAHFFN